MASVIEESGLMDLLRSLDELLAVVGLSNPIYDAANDADFDPDPAMSMLDGIGPALTGVSAAGSAGVENLAWTGESAQLCEENKDCLVTLEEFLFDLGVLFLEVVVEFLDIIFELINLLLALVIAVIVVISIIVAVAVAIAAFTAGTSLAAAASSVATTLLAFLGQWSVIVAGFVAIGQFILHFIDKFIEDLQADLFAARDAGCIRGTPLKSWDPDLPDIPGILNW